MITDRRVLDKQLREDVKQFERTQGVVQYVTGDKTSKSADLAASHKTRSTT